MSGAFGGGLFRKVAATGAALLSLVSVGQAASFGLNLAGQLEQTQMGFEVMLRSEQKALGLMGQLQKFAAATPFEFPELAQTTKQLLAYGFGAGEVVKKLSMLGDISSGLNIDLGDLAMVYGQLKVQGRAYAYDIRQFTGRGIPIVQLLAKQFKTTEQNVMAMVSAGKIGFKEIDSALQVMTSSGGIFWKMMGKQSLTLRGLWSTLKDVGGLALAGMFKEFMPEIKGALTWLIANQGKVEGNARRFTAVLRAVFVAGKVTIGWIAKNWKWLGPIIMGVVGAMTIWKVVTLAQAAAQWILNAALTANPIGLIIVGIGLLIGIIVMLVRNWDTVKRVTIGALSAAWNWLSRYIPQLRLIPPAIRLVGVVFGAVWKGVTSAAITVWGWIKKIWDLMVKVAEWSPAGLVVKAVKAIAGKGKVGAHAAGGIVSRPTVSWIGERGPEAIIPLAEHRRRAVGLWQQAGAQLGVSGGGGITVHFSPQITVASGGDVNAALRSSEDRLIRKLEDLQRDQARRRS